MKKELAELNISVVMPAYNEEKRIGETLKTVLNQDFKGKYEVVVCDNNSIDKTIEIAESFGVKVVKELKKGSRFAYDRAVKESSGDIILITNADVILPSNWISRIVEEYKDISVVGVGTKVDFYDCPNWVKTVFNIMWNLNPKKAMWGTSMSVRREYFDKVGGFDNGVNTNEDAIFSLLLEKEGKVKILEDVVVLMDGRRFNGGVFHIISEWIRSYGLNALYIQFNYLVLHKIRTFKKEFRDYR